MNERLTIRNSHFEIFRWLPIGRCDVGHGSDGKPAGVMRPIKGNIGADGRIMVPMRFFRRRGVDYKKVLEVPGLRRRISPFT